MEQEPRYVSKEEMQRMRESVKKGVERVVHPFLRRVEAQSHIRPSKIQRSKMAECCRTTIDTDTRQLL